MESKFATNIETFNECIALCTIYLMMSMSDAVQDVEVRNFYGLGFIVVLSVYLAVHLIVLFGDVCYKIKAKLYSCFFQKCTKEKSL